MKENKTSDQQRFTIFVSPFAADQLRLMASAKGMQVGRLIGQHIEILVGSPAFGSELKRALEWAECNPQPEISEDDD